MVLTSYHLQSLNNEVKLWSSDKSRQLSISFRRTIRVPDNERSSKLPPDLGKFPLFKVSDYREKLPSEIVAKGGLFMPMYQREAMWIKFTSTAPFLIKIYSGGVNVISGEHYMEDPGTKLRRQTLKTEGKSLQDYVVTPDQLWLDGIASSTGTVRQFVAMPIGSGFSVESQLTGKDTVGGISFEITPTSALNNVMNLFVKTLLGDTTVLCVKPSETVGDVKLSIQKRHGLPVCEQRIIYQGHQLDNGRTLADYNILKDATVHVVMRLRGGDSSQDPQPNNKPFEMNIAAGGQIEQSIREDTYPGTTWQNMPPITFNVQILNSAGFRQITGEAPPKSPVNAKEYAKAGKPFFKMYEEPSKVKGKFKTVKSVGEIDKTTDLVLSPRIIHLDERGRHIKIVSASTSVSSSPSSIVSSDEHNSNDSSSDEDVSDDDSSSDDSISDERSSEGSTSDHSVSDDSSNEESSSDDTISAESSIYESVNSDTGSDDGSEDPPSYCSVEDQEGILNPQGSLQPFRTIADIEEDLKKQTLLAFE